MKELSVEQKAQRYDEALKKQKIFIKVINKETISYMLMIQKVFFLNLLSQRMRR